MSDGCKEGPTPINQSVVEKTSDQQQRSPVDKYLEVLKKIDPNCFPALREMRVNDPMMNPFLLINMAPDNKDVLDQARRKFERLSVLGNRIDRLDNAWMEAVAYLFKPDKGQVERLQKSRKRAVNTSLAVRSSGLR